MKLTPLLTISGCLIIMTSGCHNYEASVSGPEQIPTRIEPGKAPAGEPVVGMPITVPDSDHAMLPVTIEHLKAWFEEDPYRDHSASDSTRYGGLASASGQRYMRRARRVHWHNVIFHDQTTDDTRVLLERQAVISRYQVIGTIAKNKDEADRTDCLLFSISDKDSNDDGMIDARDAVVGYACDKDGRNLRRVTPEGGQLLRVNYVPEHQLMYLVVIHDSNKDGKYTTHDERSLLRYRVADTGPGKPVLAPKDLERINQSVKTKK